MIATTYTPADLLQYLHNSCLGAANGQSATELVEALTQHRSSSAAERRLRLAITQLRDQDCHPICATPSAGYYYASTAAELQESLDFLRGRALTSLRLLGKLQRRCMATLIGQGELLPTLPTLPTPTPVEEWDLVGCPLRLPRRLRELAQVSAEAEGLSLSRFVATALARQLLLAGADLSAEILSLVDKEETRG